MYRRSSGGTHRTEPALPAHPPLVIARLLALLSRWSTASQYYGSLVGRTTNPPVDSLTESTFPDVVQRRGKAMRPNEFVDVEVLLVCHGVFTLEEFVNGKHLYVTGQEGHACIANHAT